MSLRALAVFAVEGIGEITAGDNLAAILAAACGEDLVDGDILAVTSKIVSKAEGRMLPATDREEAITAETVRVVATREYPGGVTRIVENRLGIVAAAAGVDASNTPEGTVLLLPLDPDASARRLRAELGRRCGVNVAVVITDTLGRPWRQGQTDAAIGLAGLAPLLDLRGETDSAGRRLTATVTAVADEIAAAADLVKGKTSGCPVAVLRGLAHLVAAPADGRPPRQEAGAADLIRPADRDMFRLGTAEAMAAGWQEGYDAGYAAGSGLTATSGLPVAGCSSTTASTP